MSEAMPDWWVVKSSLATKHVPPAQMRMGRRVHPPFGDTVSPTVQEVLAALEAAGVDPARARLFGGCLSWQDDATPEEQALIEERLRSHDERHARWERETFVRLKAKFEPQALDEETD